MEITYNEFAMSGLGESEKVYQLTSGAYSGMLVKVKQVRKGTDVDGDGIIDVIHIHTTSSFVNALGETVVVAGLPVIAPIKSDAIQTSAIAEGKVTVFEKASSFSHAAIIRVINIYVDYLSYQEIPME